MAVCDFATIEPTREAANATSSSYTSRVVFLKTSDPGMCETSACTLRCQMNFIGPTQAPTAAVPTTLSPQPPTFVPTPHPTNAHNGVYTYDNGYCQDDPPHWVRIANNGRVEDCEYISSMRMCGASFAKNEDGIFAKMHAASAGVATKIIPLSRLQCPVHLLSPATVTKPAVSDAPTQNADALSQYDCSAYSFETDLTSGDASFHSLTSQVNLTKKSSSRRVPIQMMCLLQIQMAEFAGAPFWDWCKL